MEDEKIRQGYKWVSTNTGGFWVKEKAKGAIHSHKLPIFCPHCKKITGTVDDKYLNEFGICWECHTLYVDGRQNPLINLELFKKAQ